MAMLISLPESTNSVAPHGTVVEFAIPSGTFRNALVVAVNSVPIAHCPFGSEGCVDKNLCFIPFQLTNLDKRTLKDGIN